MSDTYDATIGIREAIDQLRDQLQTVNANLVDIADSLRSLASRFNDVTCPSGYDRDGFVMVKAQVRQ